MTRKKGKCHESKLGKRNSKKGREKRGNCESRDRTSMTSTVGVGEDKKVVNVKGSQEKTE
jgi:hypothetical protein